MIKPIKLLIKFGHQTIKLLSSNTHKTVKMNRDLEFSNLRIWSWKPNYKGSHWLSVMWMIHFLYIEKYHKTIQKFGIACNF